MAIRWITKKNKHNENIHIPIEERKIRERELSLKMPEQKKENKKMDTEKKYYHLEKKYSAEVFHPLAYEDGVYTVRIYRDGTIPVDRNIYFTMVTAKSSRDAYEMVINTPKFKRWKEDVEKRIKEGKERTDWK